jgi:hypothetical protein
MRSERDAPTVLFHPRRSMRSGRPPRHDEFGRLRPFNAGDELLAHDPPHRDANEAALVAAARAGDENAFGVLLEHHRRGLECYCHLMLGDPDAARHAIAETAMTAWCERALLEPQASARIWLYRVAVRVCCEAAGDPISFGAEDRLT